MTAPAAVVHNLSYVVAGTPILTDVSFTVEPGEIRAVVGANGAGKSTCVRCLGGLAKGWTGDIVLAGHDIRRISRRTLAARVCTLPQTHGTPPAFTVRDFVGMGRYAHLGFWDGLKATDAHAIDAALEVTGVSHLRDRLLPTLSGGELQMASIAAGLAQEADLFILDEPSTFLDPKRQETLLSLIHRLNARRGIAIIIVTHDVNTAILRTHRTLALRKGSVVYDGPSSRLASVDILRAVYDMEFTVASLDGRRDMVFPRALADRVPTGGDNP